MADNVKGYYQPFPAFSGAAFAGNIDAGARFGHSAPDQ
ncbi:hypothetical protein SBV1_100039 [Verrucomicrobia bacterium]|nr:hypothetical protein SBV1_100039 [Verrucomicrobiota bacterium]